jgi:hypothetical protein
MDLETANPHKVDDSVKAGSSKFAVLQSVVSGCPGRGRSDPGQWEKLKQGDGADFGRNFQLPKQMDRCPL